MKMNKLMICVAVMLVSFSTVFAQEDAEKCKDHPLFSRMPNYYIQEGTKNYDQMDFYNAAGEDVKLEGNLTHNFYSFKTESGASEPSYYQIIKNYTDALAKIGGKKIYSNSNLACFAVKLNDIEYRIKVECTNTSDYFLNVLEMVPMKQEITANEMLDALNKDGYIALNILFDTGRSTIKAESLTIIDQIYDLLVTNTELKFSIEGHTDNVGNAETNKRLSSDRAKAVVDAVVAKGIDQTRLSFKGWGSDKPVADNRTEDGKAKNRRVEIVLQKTE